MGSFTVSINGGVERRVEGGTHRGMCNGVQRMCDGVERMCDGVEGLIWFGVCVGGVATPSGLGRVAAPLELVRGPQ